MPTKTYTFETPPHYSLFATCHAHGWKYLAPFNWDVDRQELSFAALAGTQAVDLVCSQHKRQIRALITSRRSLSKQSANGLAASIRRALDLNRETTPLFADER
ncbi:MAG TPA: hypothetical protein VGP72_18670 [Planctomycetota bacterium]|jgi:hypothetical protein